MDNQKKTISELTPDQMDKVSGGILNIQTDDYLAQIDLSDDQDNQDDQGMVPGNPLPKWPAF